MALVTKYLGNIKGPKGDKGEDGITPELINNLEYTGEENIAALDAVTGPDIVKVVREATSTIPIEEGADLNTIKIPSDYYAKGGNLNTNLPPDLGEGSGFALCVYKIGEAYIAQQLIAGDQIWIRYGNTDFSDWKNISNNIYWLTEGQNADDLRNPNYIYKAWKSSLIATLVNIPIQTGELAMMYIPFSPAGAEPYGVQILIARSGDTKYPYIYMRYFYNGTWYGWDVMTANRDLVWKKLDSIAVSDSENYIFSYNVGTKELMVSYGRENGGQSYGGSTFYVSTEEDKPAYCPLYINAEIKDMIYIHHNQSKKTIGVRRETGTDTVRFNIYYR